MHRRSETRANAKARRDLLELEKKYGIPAETKPVTASPSTVENSRSISLTEAKLYTEVLKAELQ